MHCLYWSISVIIVLLQCFPNFSCPSAQVYEGGALYDPKVLDIKDDDIMDTVTLAIARVAAASLELGYPTLASIPHSVVNGYKNVLAVSVATDYTFPLAQKVNHVYISSQVSPTSPACKSGITCNAYICA